MKKKKILVIGLACFGLTGLLVGISIAKNESVEVSAGASKSYVISSASVKNGVINSGDFYVSGGVHAAESTILFDDECDQNSKIVGKTKVKDFSSYGLSKLFNASLILKTDSFAEGGSFSISFGLPSVSSSNGHEGSTELQFVSSSSSLFLSVIEHSSGGDKVLLDSKKIDSLGESKQLAFSCSTSGSLVLSYDSTTYLDGSMNISSGVGYIGFFSKGVNTVSLSDMTIYGYSYENPENVDYTEFFDNGSYNSNVFYSASSLSGVTPSYLGVDKDTGYLHFCNTGAAHITTKYTYSNFELDFDMPSIQREATYDKDGNLTGLISNWFGIAWGLSDPTVDPSNTVQTEKWVQYEVAPIDGVDHSVKYENPRLILWDNFSPLVVQSMSYNIFDNDVVHDKTVQIKMSLVDGVFKLYNKLEDDVSYGAPIMTYDMGETPVGYLRIFTWGPGSISTDGFKYSAIANFTIDNLHISNLDNEKAKQTITDPGYTPNGVTLGSDFDYETSPDPSDLTASLISNGGQGLAKGLIMAISAIAIVLRRIIKHE